MALPTLSFVRQRTAYLRGETDYTTTDAVIDSHINSAVNDVVLAYPFSWDLTSSTLTLSGGIANLPLDYIPKWGVYDARVAGASQGDDSVYVRIDPRDRDSYGSGDYAYWITFNSSTNRYVFNATESTGTVTVYYYFFPAAMSAATDTTAQSVYCLVPDGEAVAYLAASKNWIGDERNVALSREYGQEGSARVKALYAQDAAFGPSLSADSVGYLNFS